MPRPRDDDTVPVTPTLPASGGGTGLPAAPPGGFSGQFGLSGKSRWDMVYATNPGLFAGPWAYKRWLMSLPDDPGDTEYQALLQKERDRFTQWAGIASLGQQDVVGLGDKVAKRVSRSEEQKRWQTYMGGSAMDSGVPGPTATSAAGPPAEAKKSKSQAERQGEREDKLTAGQAKYLWSQPVFRGREISDDEVYVPGGPQGGPTDTFLDQFLTENGIQLSGDSRSKATRSGHYVLMGTEHNKELNADRDVYMFTADAKAAGQRVDPALLSKYQAGLGLVVTGKMDPILENYWDQAVSMAQRSAVTGIHMSVQEWFDLIVSSAVAKRGGGGGGGGGSQPLDANDYYRAMMQVLGDISGVEG